VLLVTLVVITRIGHRIWHGARGRRRDDVAARSSGVRVRDYKALAYAVAAFFAGIGGSLLAHQYTYIDPSIFNLTMSAAGIDDHRAGRAVLPRRRGARALILVACRAAADRARRADPRLRRAVAADHPVPAARTLGQEGRMTILSVSDLRRTFSGVTPSTASRSTSALARSCRSSTQRFRQDHHAQPDLRCAPRRLRHDRAAGQRIERRSVEQIAEAGLARTFQNGRVFAG